MRRRRVRARKAKARATRCQEGRRAGATRFRWCFCRGRHLMLLQSTRGTSSRCGRPGGTSTTRARCARDCARRSRGCVVWRLGAGRPRGGMRSAQRMVMIMRRRGARACGGETTSTSRRRRRSRRRSMKRAMSGERRKGRSWKRARRRTTARTRTRTSYRWRGA
ncbi:hypothetical protein C8J57DRAFT_1334609 [Mycena rebaudengoi]|nr:hypothetical protein C8J57DRAFT_1334609 [Mycena rebaudengoi]